MNDYDYYKLGCKAQGTRSIGRKRFLAAIARYERDRDRIMAQIDSAKDKRASLRLIVQWSKLLMILDTVDDGKIIAGVMEPRKVTAASTTKTPPDLRGVDGPAPWFANRPDDPDKGDSAPGVREPRRPIAPTLIGAAAKLPPNQVQNSVDQAARSDLFSTAV